MPTIVTLEMGGTGAITAADARNTLGVMANTGGTFSGAINAATANITTIVTGNALTLSTGTASNGNIIFSSNGTEDMRITNTGMIGIFTTTPNSNLTVVGNVWATTGINAATINATTSNAATFISSAGINVGAQAINAYGQANSARDQANTGYGQANAARDQANTGYGQANAAYTQANNARADANTTFATINTTFGTVNTSLGTINTNYQAAYAQANAGYGQANAAYAQANSAYGAANTRLSASGGTLSGDLIITGNLTVSGNQTILNTEILSTEDAEIVLLSNVAGTPALNAGLIVNRGTSTNTFVRWNEVTDKWGYSDDGSTFYSYDDIRSGLVTHNTTFGTTNTTFGTTNTTFGTVNTTFGTINTNYQAAYSQANAGANLVAVYANGTVGMANANINFNNTATINVAITANATNKFANVDLTANSTALGIPTINTSLGTLNTTFGTVNTTFGTLNTTFGTINTNATNINSNAINAYAQANTATTNAGNAYGQANAAYAQANSAYGAANNRVLKAGDTMTGGLTIQADASNEQLKIIRSSNTNQQLIFGAHASNYGWIQSVEQNVGYTSLVLNRDGGNVGVGTTPAFTTGSGLEIQRATATATLRLDSSSFATELYGYTGGTGLFQLSAGYLDLGTNNTTRLRIDANGNVSIGTSSTTASLQVQGASGDAAPIFRISATAAAGSFNWASSFLNSSLGSGRNFISLIGQAESTKNSGYIGFNHSGTSGSNSNFLTFGLFGVDNILNITGAANVGIGNTAPVAKLQVTQAAPSGAGAVPSGTTAVFENAGNNYITMRHSADGGFYSGMVFEDNNIGGYVIHGDGGSSDKLFIAGYGGVDIQYGSSSSVTPGARSTVGSFTSTGLSVTGTISADTVRVTTGSLANTSATLGLMLDGNYSTGQYRHRFRKQDLGGGLPLFLDYSSGTANSYTTIARFGGGGSYNELTIYGAFEVTGSSYFGNSIRLQGTSPTITFYDTDNMTGYIHTNSNLMYILRGANGATEGGWAQVNSQWPFTFNLSNNDAVCGGNLNAVGDVVTSYSDLRLKNIRGKITNALDKVKQLSGYYYTDNDLAREKGYTNDQEQVGVLAQEIEKVLPQVLTPAPFDIEFKDGKYISRSGENYMTVKYDRIIPLLIEAIKEQQEQIEVLKKKLGV